MEREAIVASRRAVIVDDNDPVHRAKASGSDEGIRLLQKVDAVYVGSYIKKR